MKKDILSFTKLISSAPLQFGEELWLKTLRLRQVYECIRNWMFIEGLLLLILQSMRAFWRSPKHASLQKSAYDVTFLLRVPAAPSKVHQVAAQITMNRGVKRQQAKQSEEIYHIHTWSREKLMHVPKDETGEFKSIHHADHAMLHGSARTPLDSYYPSIDSALYCRFFQLQANCLADGSMFCDTVQRKVIKTCKENLNILSTRLNVF